MTIKLVKLIAVIVFAIALALYLDFGKEEIYISFSDYVVTTNLFGILLLILIFILPTYYIFMLLKKLIRNIRINRYIDEILHIIAIYDHEKDKDILMVLLKKHANIHELKIVYDLVDSLRKGKYVKIIEKTSKLSKRYLSNEFAFILLRYKALALEAIDNTVGFVYTLKYGIEYKNYNDWFFIKLVKHAIKNEDYESLPLLDSKLHTIKFQKYTDYKKCYCLIHYKKAKDALAKDDKATALLNARQAQKQLPSFSPIYDILISLHGDDYKKIQSHLKQAWIHCPNYYSMKLWGRYYKYENTNQLIKDVESMKQIDDSDGTHNDLLLSYILLHADKSLEADGYLQNVDPTHPLRKILELEIALTEVHNIQIKKFLEQTLEEEILKTGWWRSTFHLSV